MASLFPRLRLKLEIRSAKWTGSGRERETLKWPHAHLSACRTHTQRERSDEIEGKKGAADLFHVG
jgi:hypothetical protein